jgi:hypothetical protein
MPRSRPPATPPRTLAATPPPATRAPRATGAPGRFPTLAAVIASGLVVPACEAPRCGATRSDELERHGQSGARALAQGRAGEALTQVGVALGVVSHARTTYDAPAGAARPVNALQPPVPPTAPPTPPETVHPAGGPMRVLPVTPPPAPPAPPTTHVPRPTRGTRMPVTHTPPVPEVAPRGGEARISPLPHDGALPTRRA